MKTPSLTSIQLIGYFLPGFMLIFLFFCVQLNWNFERMITLFISKDTSYLVIGAILLPISFTMGLIVDAIRNGLIEDSLDEKRSKKINWEFFSFADNKEKKLVYERYFNYYVFDFNMAIVLIVVVLYTLILSVYNLYNYGCHISLPYIISFFLMGLVTYFLFKDALNLRDELANKTEKWMQKYNAQNETQQ
jgi:hypothetical protein